MRGSIQITHVKLLETFIGVNSVRVLESLTKAPQKTHTRQTRISCSLKNVKSHYPASRVLPSKWGIVTGSFPCAPSPSLWKSPQINKRHRRGSLHKQAHSRHFFPPLRLIPSALLFQADGRQCAQLCCQQTKLSKEISGPRQLTGASANISGLGVFKTCGFPFKIIDEPRRTPRGRLEGWENNTEWRDGLLHAPGRFSQVWDADQGHWGQGRTGLAALWHTHTHFFQIPLWN